jgi:hypothetical protein
MPYCGKNDTIYQILHHFIMAFYRLRRPWVTVSTAGRLRRPAFCRAPDSAAWDQAAGNIAEAAMWRRIRIVPEPSVFL